MLFHLTAQPRVGEALPLVLLVDAAVVTGNFSCFAIEYIASDERPSCAAALFDSGEFATHPDFSEARADALLCAATLLDGLSEPAP